MADILDFSWTVRAPFKPISNFLRVENALYLAQMAALAYEIGKPPDVIRPALRALGYDNIDLFQRNSSEAFLAVSRDHALLVYTGTNSLLDAWYDLRSARKPVFIHGRRMKVHVGFDYAGGLLDPLILPRLEELRQQNVKVVVCGHSLGGALAKRIAAYYPELVNMTYTFGAPRFGNGRFRQYCRDVGLNIFQLALATDPVTWAPPYGLFHHLRVAQLRAGSMSITEGVSEALLVLSHALEFCWHCRKGLDYARTLFRSHAIAHAYVETLRAIVDYRFETATNPLIPK